MRQDNRPYWLYRAARALEGWRQRHFIEPQFDSVGPGLQIVRPLSMDVFGRNIHVGAHVHMCSHPSAPLKLCTWPAPGEEARITIGDHALLMPGTQIIAARAITIGPGTMLASGVYVSDSDWHDLYDRTREGDRAAPIVLGPNVWVGFRAIIGKGVTIGANSVIGAGAVVTRDVPENTIWAGNPARQVRTLDPDRPMVTRAALFSDPAARAETDDALGRYVRRDRRFLCWLRARLAPSRTD
ncbi:MAG: acyltransferase [Alphaproteobacteria bacterium]|nr:acyltransferase [Alphaproteobacteria bacterium]